MLTPIIINNTVVKNCIIKQGVRYCEDQNLNKHELGIIFGGVFCFMIWVALWVWISDKYFNLSLVVACGGAIGLPLLLLSLYFLLS